MSQVDATLENMLPILHELLNHSEAVDFAYSQIADMLEIESEQEEQQLLKFIQDLSRSVACDDQPPTEKQVENVFNTFCTTLLTLRKFSVANTSNQLH